MKNIYSETCRFMAQDLLKAQDIMPLFLCLYSLSQIFSTRLEEVFYAYLELFGKNQSNLQFTDKVLKITAYL